jgi:hypothetical protein
MTCFHIPRTKERRAAKLNDTIAIEIWRECKCGRKSRYVRTRKIVHTSDALRSAI